MVCAYQGYYEKKMVTSDVRSAGVEEKGGCCVGPFSVEEKA